MFRPRFSSPYRLHISAIRCSQRADASLKTGFAVFCRCWWSVLVGLALTPAAGAQESAERRPQAVRFSEVRTFERQDQLAPPAENAIVFVGSSSIRFWDLQRWLPGYPLINRGYGGSIMSDSVYFADQLVTKYRPRMVIVYAGDNDVARDIVAEQVAADFGRFVKKIRQQLPQVRVIYISIKPSPARWQLWNQMADANAKIKQLVDADPQMDYVDVATPMLGADGRPRRELFVMDGLHLNDAGYRLWTDLIRPYLQRND